MGNYLMNFEIVGSILMALFIFSHPFLTIAACIVTIVIVMFCGYLRNRRAKKIAAWTPPPIKRYKNNITGETI